VRPARAARAVLHSAALTTGAALPATLPVMASVSRANGVMTLPFANNLGGRWLKVRSPLPPY
jgi:hypothetical protein